MQAKKRKIFYSAVGSMVAFSLLLLSGCARLEIKMGARVPLNMLQVTAMEASLAKNPAIAPGEKASLVVQFNGADGKVWKTEGAGGGKILWSDLTVTGSVVAVSKKGVVSLAHDPRKSDGKTGQVTVTAPSHPDLHAVLDIPLRYNIRYRADFSGTNGSNGLDGSAGSNGFDGSVGSIDLTNPSAGGNGGDAGHGGSGGRAGRGGMGVLVHPTA